MSVGEELNGGGQGAGVGGTQLKKARATLLSVGSRHTSSRVSRTHVASLKSPLSLTVAHTRARHPPLGLPSLFEPFVLFSSAFVFFFALSSISSTTINMYKIYIYISSMAARFSKSDDSKMVFRVLLLFSSLEETKRNLYVYRPRDAIPSKSGWMKIWRFVIPIYIIRINK